VCMCKRLVKVVRLQWVGIGVKRVALVGGVCVVVDVYVIMVWLSMRSVNDLSCSGCSGLAGCVK